MVDKELPAMNADKLFRLLVLVDGKMYVRLARDGSGLIVVNPADQTLEGMINFETGEFLKYEKHDDFADTMPGMQPQSVAETSLTGSLTGKPVDASRLFF